MIESILKVITYPVMVIAGIGASLSIAWSMLEFAQIYSVPAGPQILFVGVFLVWLPTIFLMNRLSSEFKQKDVWKAALRGCPRWMRVALWSIFASVFVSFLLPLAFGKSPGDSRGTFALFAAVFYSVSFCVAYSFLNVEKFDATRRCLNGHAISPLAKFCDECGAPVAPDPHLLTRA